MKKSRLVVFVITVLTILTLIVTCTPSVRKNMKLGLDLQGGFEILYEVSPLEGKKLPSMTAVAFHCDFRFIDTQNIDTFFH